MFYPFRDECHLEAGQPSSLYYSKLNEPGVIEVINNNKSLVHYSDLVNDTFLNYRLDYSPRWDPF